MPETVKRGAVPFSAKSVLRDFRNVFCNRRLFGAATISLSYIPMMSWVAVSPVILIDAGRLNNFAVRLATQVPVFGAVIVANAIVARFVKDPTEPRFIWRAVPIQLVGLALLIIGNSAVTARLAVVGAGHQFVCFRDWFDLPDLIPLYAFFQ